MTMTRWLGLLGLLFWAAGCADDREPPPSFILISLDTVRADHLGLYGYGRNTSPQLDAILGEGLVFDNAFSVSNNTLVAHASLFTGLQPAAHGADPDTPLAEGYVTLAEDLQRAGYQTAAFAANGDWLSAAFGLDRGFEVFESEHRAAPKVLKSVEAWLRRRDPARPFFLFVHLYDAHSDYGRRAYGAPRGIHGLFTAGYEGALLARSDEPKKASRYLRAAARGEVDMSLEELRFVEGQYDEGLFQLDRDLGPFLESLFPLVDTWLFVTADHGEEFREHGGFLHDQLFAETTRVPLVAVPPLARRNQFKAAGRSDALVRIVDLRRTLLALAGLPDPEQDQGQSLLAALRGEQSGAEAVFAKGAKGGVSVRTRDYSYFENEATSDASGGQRLFDLRTDPAETRDLSAQPALQSRVAAMQRLLEQQQERDAAIRERHPTPPRVELDAEAQDRLRSLGYGD